MSPPGNFRIKVNVNVNSFLACRVRIGARLDQSRAQLVIAIESIEAKPDGIACADNKKRVLDRLREAGITPDLGKLDGGTVG
ncbi:hypothetical protein QZN29_21115 [Burkholderia multivorans]|uniref:hypothetical protein n=1 Tax=Burkholderia multivorans TaxID=87883 RepID=UPI001FC7CA29|nr:hypothetical protein [Burkholderia multivorans]MCA8260726.1 hypothetical protein [Burkholderia multivorans]MCO1360649.1 hypothetical protein [Burkholderia multivorans]MCO1382456.1 hypothetical protein [Burkholderia multivorans]MCO1402593.1 hypothetical protein [Burkholderia multivorans]MCO1420416.1 hypothetical protein [Burkholderia multivorans]